MRFIGLMRLMFYAWSHGCQLIFTLGQFVLKN